MLAHDPPPLLRPPPTLAGSIQDPGSQALLAISSHACKYEFCLRPRYGFFPLRSLTYVLKWRRSVMASFHGRALEGARFPLELIF